MTYNFGNDLPSKYDFLSDQMAYENNTNYVGIVPPELAIMMNLFSSATTNETIDKLQPNQGASDSSAITSPQLYSFETLLPSSTVDTNSYVFLSNMSFWFVLIVNPIVILFGVTGNLLATYILMRCNIAKLPVSFYTIMLNLSDTLNLLIPVFIFWLDNCINRVPDRGYFRDRSNFLCKALMCPDQLFATLSAWYMCAISFNRWYSVCRPSSYFFHTATNVNASTVNSATSIYRGHEKHTTGSPMQSSQSSIAFRFPINCCSCLASNMKLRQHLQAFRNITLITLIGVLCCLYPIFMHEVQPFININKESYDLSLHRPYTHVITWQRCSYSKQHEYAYDIIGIILSCFLHILPLTFVAAMNTMIILRLKQRQYRMAVATTLFNVQTAAKKQKSLHYMQKKMPTAYTSALKELGAHRTDDPNCQSALVSNRKDQATSTDFSIQTMRALNKTLVKPNTKTAKRHHSRDKAITIMLVSVALSYLALTFPYRLYWLYHVYLKRANPAKLNSIYLLKMHYIDHILRTIRNVHYGTNFIFFILLSKTFRRKFRQIFLERLFRTAHNLLRRNSSTVNVDQPSNNMNSPQQRPVRSTVNRKRSSKGVTGDLVFGMESVSRSLCDEVPSFAAEGRINEDEVVPIIELEQNNLSRYKGELRKSIIT